MDSRTSSVTRRRLLAASSAGAVLVSGCLDTIADETNDARDADGGAGSTSTAADGDTDPAESTPDESDATDHSTGPGNCGIGNRPLSTLLESDVGDASSRYEGLEPSVAIENERAEPLAVSVTITDHGDAVVEYELDLEPGERAVKDDVAETARLTGVTVEFADGTTVTDSWDGRSSRQHGLAITESGIVTGYQPPLSGPPDTMHDCYAGNKQSIRVHIDGSEDATITINDLCRESESVERVRSIEPGIPRIEGALVGGGMYDVTVDVDDGDHARYEYREQCWGLTVSVSADGEPEITTTPVY